MALESVHEIVRKAEQNYLQGNTRLGKYVNFSMYETIERIDAYLNSKHTSGPADSLGRPKPFFNITTAAVNVWYRATDIDRKDIRFVPRKSSSVVLAFVANVLLQNWMNKERFGQFLNQWGRALARYGSCVVKFVEQDGKLIPSVIPWNRFIADPVQFDALPRIEKLYLTPAQLRKHPLYDQSAVDKLIQARQARKTTGGETKDTMDEFIELYEVHGEMDTRLLQDNPDEIDDKDVKYRQQMHVISFVAGEKLDEYEDFCLYKGKEAHDPYMITHLIEEDGRTLSIGAVEYLFDAQWMQNHTAKNMKDTLDLASKLIFQTADPRYMGRNVLNAIETGDIFIFDGAKAPNGLQRVANDKPDITALQNFGTMWQNMARELTSTPDALRGNTLPSGTPYSLGAILQQQAGSLFEIMTENKGLSIEDMVRGPIVRNMKRLLKNKDEIAAILDDAGITEIDSMYVPAEAVRRYNERTKEQMLNYQPGGELPQPFDPAVEQGAIKQELSGMGNKRFFRPDELSQKQWDEVFSDFEWDSVTVEVTNEPQDKQAILTSLSSAFQTIASLAGRPMTPDERLVFGKLMDQTGTVSTLQLSQTAAQPAPNLGAPAPQQPLAPNTVDGGGLPTIQ